jgi:Flp pilus assembly protein TadG
MHMQALVSGLILIAVFGVVAAGAAFVAVRLLAGTRAPAGRTAVSAAAPSASLDPEERPDA